MRQEKGRKSWRLVQWKIERHTFYLSSVLFLEIMNKKMLKRRVVDKWSERMMRAVFTGRTHNKNNVFFLCNMHYKSEYHLNWRTIRIFILERNFSVLRSNTKLLCGPSNDLMLLVLLRSFIVIADVLHPLYIFSGALTTPATQALAGSQSCSSSTSAW